MSELVSLQGGWFWFILAGLLLIGELLSPGVFLMWLAAAAVIAGLSDVVLNLSWTAEIILFGVASLLLVVASWKYVSRSWNPVSDQPHLNNRHNGYVGRVFVLERPIANGAGKLRIEDSLWDVDGPDAEVGARVKVTSVNGLRLVVELT
jgi:membrane protein implicated in regulation of membrane protease activity